MTAFRFAGGSSLVRSSASAASRAATSRSPFFAWNNSLVMSSAARIAALCVSTRRRCARVARRLVLLLRPRPPLPRLGRVLAGAPAPPTTPLQLGFALDGTRAPPRQLVRHVAKDGLELVEHLRISSLSVLRQAHPPAPPAPAPTAHPRPARAASARDRRTSSAKPRRVAPPRCWAPDTRRTLRAARAAALPSAARHRRPVRR